jgi:alpha-beta hydrolase superfamily lysophospholipase
MKRVHTPRTDTTILTKRSVYGSAAVAIIFFAGCGGSDPTFPEPVPLTLDTADGFRVAATLFPAAEPDPPGLILVHQVGATRAHWEPFAARAQQGGYAVITFDLRGHGGTAELNPDRPKFRALESGDWQAAQNDIAAAANTLLDAGADETHIGIVGASIGANLAAAFAAPNDVVQALVLISPGEEYRGVTVTAAFEAYGQRPSLLLAAENDTYAAKTARALHASSEGFCELREYAGTYHGTDLLDAHPAAMGLILDWLDTVLAEAR